MKYASQIICITFHFSSIGDCPRNKLKKALEYINKRATAIVARLLQFRQCQTSIQDQIITKSVQEFPVVPVSSAINQSSALQSLFLKEENCAFNIRGRLMKWKMQMMTVKKMVEHEIIYEQEGFHSAFESKLKFHLSIFFAIK